MSQPPAKKELIEWFSQMKILEKSAEDFYLQVASDPRIGDEKVKETFKRIAGDENRHTQLVQIVINIINNNL